MILLNNSIILPPTSYCTKNTENNMIVQLVLGARKDDSTSMVNHIFAVRRSDGIYVAIMHDSNGYHLLVNGKHCATRQTIVQARIMLRDCYPDHCYQVVGNMIVAC